ncbi:MAG: SIMPL domain-containing protein [Pyrinomonadaceae bacterium]|nr:SIMPL domain-containing protein [Pyrinomonadaceae bacterium]
MKTRLLILLVFSFGALSVFAQESGNRTYNRNAARPQFPTTGISYGNGELLIDALVLLNAPPDEFIAVFGAAQVAPTAVESNQKVNAQIERFLSDAIKLGVVRSDTFVDFITQNRVYSFSPPADGVIREIISGFETKKNIAIKYKDRALLEKLLAAASQASIFDLIKVDYVVNDMAKIRGRLFEEAVRVVKQKEETYVRSLGLVVKRNALVQETYGTYYPSELYQTYTAFESGTVDPYYGSGTGARVIRERKSSTSYLEPLDPSTFDAVLNPAPIEPMVQCTLYIKVSYGVAR